MNLSIKHLLGLEKQEKELNERVEKGKSILGKLIEEIKSKAGERDRLKSEIFGIKKEVSIYSPSLDLINVGFFEEPEYLFETSDRFKEEIKIVREKQKDIIPSIVEVWQRDHNDWRSHGLLDNLTPTQYAVQCRDK